jgi:hypothetical protein
VNSTIIDIIENQIANITQDINTIFNTCCNATGGGGGQQQNLTCECNTTFIQNEISNLTQIVNGNTQCCNSSLTRIEIIENELGLVIGTCCGEGSNTTCDCNTTFIEKEIINITQRLDTIENQCCNETFGSCDCNNTLIDNRLDNLTMRVDNIENTCCNETVFANGSCNCDTTFIQNEIINITTRLNDIENQCCNETGTCICNTTVIQNEILNLTQIVNNHDQDITTIFNSCCNEQPNITLEDAENVTVGEEGLVVDGFGPDLSVKVLRAGPHITLTSDSTSINITSNPSTPVIALSGAIAGPGMATAICPAGKLTTGGGCFMLSSLPAPPGTGMFSSYPATTTSWSCVPTPLTPATTTTTAYVVCI